MSEIRAVFPKHIYKKDNVCVDLLGMFKERVYELQSQYGFNTNSLLNVKSTHKTCVSFHEDPMFKSLVDQIYESVVEYGMHIGYGPETMLAMQIKNMWVNISDKGGYNFPHTHPGSLFSGAFYIESVPENKIVFFENYINTEMPLNAELTSYDNVQYDCVPGRLLIFKSDMPHGNPPQQTDGEKIIISFNIAR